MNTNFIGQPDSCVGYIKRKSSEKLTNQQLADNFMGSYSKKYCGDKDFIKSLLEAYPDSKNFQEKKSVTMDPRLLVVTNSDINLIMESLSKSINHSNIRRHTLSSVAINDLWVYFGFIITEHLEQEIYFGYLSLEPEVVAKLSKDVLDGLYDITFLANHDFLHGISLGNENVQDSLFKGIVQNKSEMSNYEYMSLSFHYTLFQDIFEKHPEIKEKVVEKVKKYMHGIESNNQLNESERGYLRGIYLYFLWRILPCKDWPRGIKKYLTNLIIFDTYPDGAKIRKNSKTVDNVYQQLRDGDTIIPQK